MLDAANTAVAEATAALEAFRFDEYAAACYRFTWNVFCDWFLEFAKPVLWPRPMRSCARPRRTCWACCCACCSR